LGITLISPAKKKRAEKRGEKRIRHRFPLSRQNRVNKKKEKTGNDNPKTKKTHTATG